MLHGLKKIAEVGIHRTIFRIRGIAGCKVRERNDSRRVSRQGGMFFMPIKFFRVSGYSEYAI
jgi:hypothetical protein